MIFHFYDHFTVEFLFHVYPNLSHWSPIDVLRHYGETEDSSRHQWIQCQHQFVQKGATLGACFGPLPTYAGGQNTNFLAV